MPRTPARSRKPQRSRLVKVPVTPQEADEIRRRAEVARRSIADFSRLTLLGLLPEHERSSDRRNAA